MTDLSMSACAGNTTIPAIEPSDLDVAISVAQQLIHSDQVLSLREALRLLLRALNAEPVDPSFAAEFPTIATHLAAERGEQR